MENIGWESAESFPGKIQQETERISTVSNQIKSNIKISLIIFYSNKQRIYIKKKSKST
jgi:hypothetical protein